MPPCTILLVEDQQVLRLGLKVALDKRKTYLIVGEAADGEDAVKQAHIVHPDVVLMDVGLPGMDGIEATWRIKHELPRTRVIMFTSRNTPEDVTAALGAGADGYCIKDASIDQIAQAIDTVISGKVWLHPAIAGSVVLNQKAELAKTGVELSFLEMDVLNLIKDGVANQDIADRLQSDANSVADVMRKIIHRYVEQSEHAAVNVTRKTPISENKNRNFSDEWFVQSMESLSQGKIFADKYLIESALGSGGSGAVFKARHLYMDRTVAIKLLNPEFSNNPQAMRSFQREAKSIANLEHRNIISVYDFGVTARREPFLVMEYLAGKDLKEILENEDRLDRTRFLRIFLQVCDALSAAHAKGVIHCDLKPSNILVSGSDSDETVKLVDFGLAQMLPREPHTDAQITTKLFTTGTPAYMSPEQCSGAQLDQRTDIYSLGCIMYEAMTDEVAFTGETVLEVLNKQLQYMPVPNSSLCRAAGFPIELERAILKMLRKDRALRFQTIEDVRYILLSLA